MRPRPFFSHPARLVLMVLPLAIALAMLTVWLALTAPVVARLPDAPPPESPAATTDGVLTFTIDVEAATRPAAPGDLVTVTATLVRQGASAPTSATSPAYSSPGVYGGAGMCWY